MPNCYRCGDWVEIRVIDGRPIPIHESGSCSGWAGGSGGWTTTLRTSSSGEWFTFLFGEYPSYVNPNARCPVCGAAVFFYQSPFGGRVFFDELGPPWPKHPCTSSDDSLRVDLRSLEPSALRKRIHLLLPEDPAASPPRTPTLLPEWLKQGWKPFLFESVQSMASGFDLRGRILEAGGQKGPSMRFKQANFDATFTIAEAGVSIARNLVCNGNRAADFFIEEVVFIRATQPQKWEFASIRVDAAGELATLHLELKELK